MSLYTAFAGRLDCTTDLYTLIAVSNCTEILGGDVTHKNSPGRDTTGRTRRVSFRLSCSTDRTQGVCGVVGLDCADGLEREIERKAAFTLYPSPCPYQSPCPNNSHFLIKLEAVFRLHQFPYQSPIQCHQISVRSVSNGPPTVKNWYGRPFPSESCKPLYKITLWRLARQLWT